MRGEGVRLVMAQLAVIWNKEEKVTQGGRILPPLLYHLPAPPY